MPHHWVVRLVLVAIILISPLPEFYAQVLQLDQQKTELRLIENTYSTLGFRNTISKIYSFDVKTNAGNFSQIRIDGFGYSNEIGTPQLPVIKKLIEVPTASNINTRIIAQSFQDFQLDEFGIVSPIIPSQPPVSKSDDPSQIPFEYNPNAYVLDQFTNSELVTISQLGQMRGFNLARLEISPVKYNPVQNKLRVYDNIEIRITFEDAQPPDNFQFIETRNNRYFKSFGNLIFNFSEVPTDALPGSETITYIIVADPMFQEALQPFVEWKTKKGFRIAEAYTNNPEVGNTKESIKSYLQNFYDSPPVGYNPQTFVLLVGDIDQVPSFNGTTGNHASDLYYCEYTEDHFPEAFYGRFSANNIDELQPQIDKTLEYEQYAFPDPSFLDEVVLVAGYDAAYGQIHGNGQINYGTENYFNLSNGLYSNIYLQPEPSGANYAEAIKQNVSDGAAYANYTAHCSAQGWANPAFLISHVSSLANAHKYPLMVGNCCTSVDFRITCFGEELLRAPLKGAIGYVGGSNNTYWNEDFWWSIGFESISSNPPYNIENPGMYDRLFHTDQEILSTDWYITQGQIPQAGNLAVSQSGSTREIYYWEIYHLMGDPSLMTYFSQPDDTYVSFPGILIPDLESFIVNTEPYAYIAISHDGFLHGTALADENGVGEIIFNVPLQTAGIADIVITGQNLKPYIGQINVIEPDGAFILVQNTTVNDDASNGNGLAEYGEIISLNLVLKNLGTETANDVTLQLFSNDDFVEINDNSATLPGIDPDEEIFLNDIFDIQISTQIPNEHKIEFQLDATDGNEIWTSSFNISCFAPELVINEFAISDIEGNNNGKLEPGESAMITIMVENEGSSDAFGVVGELATANGYITIQGEQFQEFGNINKESTAAAEYQLFAEETTPFGQVVLFTLNLIATPDVSFQDEFTITVGQVPVLIVDLDVNKSSANKIFDDITNLGISAELVEVLPENLTPYASVFVCLGVYNQNYQLTPAEGQTLADYLNSGGMLYMEGGDTWFYDPQTAVHSMFGIEGISDGEGDLGSIAGADETFAAGMEFNYTGENNWIDRLEPIGLAFEILSNQSPSYICGIANEQPNYKTVGVSFEYSGLNEDLRSLLMQAYLEFFNIEGYSSMSLVINAEPEVFCNGESSQLSAIIYGGSGNYSYQWSPGDYLSDPTIYNPVATPESSTLFTVIITDLITGNQLSKTQMIEVKPVPDAPVIMQNGEFLVSNIQFGNQWFGENGLIPGANGPEFKPSAEGNYYSKIISPNGCASDSSNVIYYQPTYIEELIKQGSLRLYPNPSRGNFNLDLVATNSDYVKVDLLNGFGQNIYSKTFDNLKRIGINTVTIDIANLAHGVYTVKIQDDERLISRKVILSK
jgi:hypothetical protein